MPSMASSLSLRLLLLAVGSFRTAAAYCAEDESCIHFPVIHSTNKNVFTKRAVEVQLANRSDIAYYAQLNIGTPAQQVYVQLDTGSFELWVNPTCTGLSIADSTFCQGTGSYDPDESSTAVDMGTGKTLSYGIGSANITYVQDSLALPGAATPMTSVQFGVANASVQEFSGILGIGYGMGLTTDYPNFVDELALQNQTAVKAFSVGLGSKTEQEGAITFGGVDTSKFSGKLVTLPIVPADDSPDGVPRYWVSMDNVSLTPPNGDTKTYADTSMDVFFDTGATLTLLPTKLADEIGKDFGAQQADINGYYNVDCSLNDLPGTVNFAFPGIEIKVPYNEFIRETSSGACVLGITGSDTFTLLGDTFMRSAYAVFDLETNALHVQQYQNCGATAAAVADVSQFVGLEGLCNAAEAKVNVGMGSGTGPVGESSVLGTPTATGGVMRSTLAVSGSPSTATGAAATPTGSTSGGGSSGSASPEATASTTPAASSMGSEKKPGSPIALVVAVMVMLLAM